MKTTELLYVLLLTTATLTFWDYVYNSNQREQIEAVLKLVDYNDRRDVYWTELSQLEIQLNLAQIGLIVAKDKPDQFTEMQRLINDLAQRIKKKVEEGPPPAVQVKIDY